MAWRDILRLGLGLLLAGFGMYSILLSQRIKQGNVPTAQRWGNSPRGTLLRGVALLIYGVGSIIHSLIPGNEGWYNWIFLASIVLALVLLIAGYLAEVQARTSPPK